MSKSLTAGGALLLLAAFISSADAGMMGGIAAPTAMSRGDTRIPVTSSIASARTFSPDGPQLRKDHWKKPIDSDGGGAEDFPKKHPTKTSGNGGVTFDGIIPDNRIYHPYYPHNPHHYGYGDSSLPLACRGRPNGC